MKTSKTKTKPATGANGDGRSGNLRWTAKVSCLDCTPAPAVCQIPDDYWPLPTSPTRVGTMPRTGYTAGAICSPRRISTCKQCPAKVDDDDR
jgi:hypothetical protein